MRRCLVILLVCIGTSCKEPAPKKPAAAGAGPQTRATVVTIRTTIQPDNKTHTHTLVIADNQARSTDELDQWRLYDTRAKTVTFVDDVAKTSRTESFDALLKKHREALAAQLPGHYPRAYVKKDGAELRIEVGNYRRRLKLAEQRAIPAELFAMMQASDAATSPLAPMMRAAGDALVRTRAFPMHDHSELPYADKKLIVEREVVSIAQQNVPAALLRVPPGYRDLTPKPAAARP
ncbi:MAG TPA: hypothetical protein VKB93_05015 [Thermoanaerobaculia bacterium]|nr:hypothetical protein [Thermoanaerobaculia bacterium]